MSYESMMDQLYESTQIDFLQYSIDTIGLNEGFDIGGKLKSLWGKIKGVWSTIVTKVQEFISFIGTKFKGKDKEAEKVVADIKQEAKSTEANKAATENIKKNNTEKASSANAEEIKPGEKSSSGPQNTKLAVVNNKIQCKILNNSKFNKFMEIARGEVQETQELAEIISDENNLKGMVYNASSMSFEEISKAKTTIANNVKDFEELKNDLFDTLITDVINGQIALDIYKSFKACDNASTQWNKIAGAYKKIVQDTSGKLDRIINNSDKFLQQNNSNEENKGKTLVITKFRDLLSVTNKTVVEAYKIISSAFQQITKAKSDAFASLLMMRAAYKQSAY